MADGTNKSTRKRLVTGEYGRDKSVPELNKIVKYDPFPVDIFTVGNMIKTSFIKVRFLFRDS